MTPVPKIALVGRPNVGKSTLFNRISGHRQAITDNRPGSTRDRNYAQVSWQGVAFELIDTGGLLLNTDDPLLGPAADQARRAIEEAALVLFVVDGRAGLLPDDADIGRELRKSARAVVLVVNKVERGDDVGEFVRLGFDRVFTISAEHGIGIGDLLDAAVAGMPKAVQVEEDEREPPLRLALVGRPNVGKSSLLNAFLGVERAVVSAIPGTTRDSVDSPIELAGHRYLLVDTAGIRRIRHLKENVDHVSMVQAERSVRRSHVAVLLLDAVEGLREMDAVIAGDVVEAGRGLVIAVNKWDLARSRPVTQRAYAEEIERHLKFVPYAPVVFISAARRQGLTELMSAVERVGQARLTRVSTGALNRMLEGATRAHAPKGDKGAGGVKILFATQIGIAPPTFMISLNHKVGLHFSYRRYLENQLRKSFGFEGTPLVLKVRTRPH